MTDATALEEEKVAEQFPDEIVVPLVKPIVLSNKTITELTMREPTAGQLAQAQQAGPLEHNVSIVLIGLVSGTHPTIVKQLCGRDYRACGDALARFLPDGASVGGISLPT